MIPRAYVVASDQYANDPTRSATSAVEQVWGTEASGEANTNGAGGAVYR